MRAKIRKLWHDIRGQPWASQDFLAAYSIDEPRQVLRAFSYRLFDFYIYIVFPESRFSQIYASANKDL